MSLPNAATVARVPALTVAHLADIHVRDVRRDEYRDVFTQTFAKIRSLGPDVIVIAGDVFDMKTRVSPMNISDVVGFITSLADIAPVVVIPGNHDMNMNVTGSPDLLSPLFEAGGGFRHLQPPRVTLWRKRTVKPVVMHTAHGDIPVVWVVAVPDEPLPDPAAVGRACDAAMRRVDASCGGPVVMFVFHESIAGSRFPNGMAAFGDKMTPEYLQRLGSTVLERCGCLLGLGGDIHLRQEAWRQLAPVPIGAANGGAARVDIINAAAVWYPGSLVQQNFGEEHTGHGFLEWKVRPTGHASAPWHIGVTEFDIPNDRAVLTVRIVAEMDETSEPIPAAPRAVRLTYDSRTPRKSVDAHVKRIESRFRVTLRSVEPTFTPDGADRTGAADLITRDGMKAGPAGLANVRRDAGNIDVHLRLIGELLSESPTHLIDAVKAVHRERFASQDVVDGARGVRFRLIRFEFDNMFCYGAGNIIDFRTLEGGLSGAVAPNRAGKSALLDALLFVLYDVVPRGTKKTVVNGKATRYQARLELELDGVSCTITKTGTSWVRSCTEVGFHLGGDNLTGPSVKQTYEIIRDHIGCYSDVIATVIARPEERAEFVSMSPADRRATVSRLLRVSVFEKLHAAAGAEVRAGTGELRGIAPKGPLLLADRLKTSETALEKVNTDREKLAKVLSDIKTRLSESEKLLNVAAKIEQDARIAFERVRVSCSVHDSLPVSSDSVAELLEHEITRRDQLELIDPAVLSAAQDILSVAPPIADDHDADDIINGPSVSVTARDITRAKFLAEEITTIRRARGYRSCQDCWHQLTQVSDSLRIDRAVGSPCTAEKIRKYVAAAEEIQASAAADLALPAIAGRPTEDRHEPPTHADPNLLGTSDVVEAHRAFMDADVSQVLGEFLSTHEITLTPGCAACDRIARAVSHKEKRGRLRLRAAWSRSAAAQAAWLTDQHAQATHAIRLAGETEERMASEVEMSVVQAELDALVKAAASLVRIQGQHDRVVERIEQLEAAVAVETALRVLDESFVRASADHDKKRGATAALRGHQLRGSECRATLDEKATSLRRDVQRETENLARYTERSRQHEIAVAYRKVLDPRKGIAATLLSQARGEIAMAADAVLSDCDASFRVEISDDFGVNLRDFDARWSADVRPGEPLTSAGAAIVGAADVRSSPPLPAELGSGYQRFVLSLAFRIALARMTEAPLPSCLILDEGFGCLDDENLPRVIQCLESCVGGRDTRLLFVITHIEGVRTRLVRPVQITMTAAGTSSIFAAPPKTRRLMRALAPPEPEAVAARSVAPAGGTNDPLTQARSIVAGCVETRRLIPELFGTPFVADARIPGGHAQLTADREKVGKVRCRPCGVAVFPNRVLAHVRSKGHAARTGGLPPEFEAIAGRPDHARCKLCDVAVRIESHLTHAATVKHARLKVGLTVATKRAAPK